jgi:hypothetical protein
MKNGQLGFCLCIQVAILKFFPESHMEEMDVSSEQHSLQ